MLVGLVAAGALLVRRHHLEELNRSTELLLDYQAVIDLARATGQEEHGRDLLAHYRSLGVSSLAVPEWTLDDLELEGVARVFNGLQLRALSEVSVAARPGHVYLVFEQEGERAAIERNLTLALGKERVQSRGMVLDVAIDLPTLRGMGLGFLPERLNALADQGWQLWLRPENKPIPATRILENLTDIRNVRGVIFGGLPNEAVGYPRELKEAALWLDAHNLRVGYVELSPEVQQKGIQTVARTIPHRVVRVMAVVPAHQARLMPETVVSMYSLGARERNLRLLYLRPYTAPWREVGDLTATNQALIQGLSQELAGRTGLASTFPLSDQRPGPLLALGLGLVSMGILSGAFLLLLEVVPLRPTLVYGLIGLGAGGVAAWSFLGLPPVGRLLLCLLSSIALPVLGMVVSFPFLEAVGARRSLGSVLSGSMALTIRVTMISLAGALMSAALLYETPVLLGLTLFRGVKLLSLAVPLAVLAFYVARLGGRKELMQVLNLDLKLWHALGLGLLAMLGLLYVLRTGNVGAPGSEGAAMEMERALRRFLDAVMGVRPRFKEFVLGHPAMMLAPVLLWVGWRRLVWLALVAAAVGQASLVDTFAHLHTPVAVSLVRTFLGLLVGWAIGLLAALVVVALARFLKRFWPALPQAHPDNGATHAPIASAEQAVTA
ncbi:MAG: hypothetical protein AMXMBFR33_07040 [Candidatus Xenobia bacterium]